MMPVYFVQNGTGGPIKIGFAGNVARRMTKLRADCPDPVLLAVLDGGRDTEAELHSRFDGCRIRGEWFSPSAELMAFVTAQPRPEQRRRGPSLTKTSGHPLVIWMAQEGITRTEFAAKIGIEQGSLSDLCRGRSWLSRKTARAIERATGGEVTASDFVHLNREGEAA